MTELLGCPFCGGKNITLRCEQMPPPESRPWYWAVWCECGARCKADANIYKGDAKARAIAAWNRRSPSRPLILEEAAKVADEFAETHRAPPHHNDTFWTATNLAKAIRSLADKEKGDE